MRTLNTTVFTGAAALLAALCIIASSPARADDVVTQSRNVRLHGLDLSAPSDQAILRNRLMVAAARVCTEGNGVDLNEDAFLECRKAAFNQAWSKATVLIAEAKSRSLMAAKLAPAWAQPQAIVASAAAPAALLPH